MAVNRKIDRMMFGNFFFLFKWCVTHYTVTLHRFDMDDNNNNCIITVQKIETIALVNKLTCEFMWIGLLKGISYFSLTSFCLTYFCKPNKMSQRRIDIE